MQRASGPPVEKGVWRTEIARFFERNECQRSDFQRAAENIRHEAGEIEAKPRLLYYRIGEKTDRIISGLRGGLFLFSNALHFSRRASRIETRSSIFQDFRRMEGWTCHGESPETPTLE